MGHRKRGRAAKHARAALSQKDPAAGFSKSPHSFVFHRGNVGHNVLQLVQDVRKIMEPFTASSLKVMRKNSLKDFVSVAGPLGVTHMVMFTKTEIAVNMRIIRLPRGPTVTFRVLQYSLSRDVVSAINRPVSYEKQFTHHPLLVMNNFGEETNAMKLLQRTFQNFLPSINVNSVNLNNVRRCFLVNYSAESDSIYLRHYTVKAVPTGISRSAKKLVQSKVPNLGRYSDISEYFLKPGQLSESEYELDGGNEVELSQAISTRGCKESARCAIRLVELGPRMTLQLLKIEDGICDGEVLYHRFIKKTPSEIARIKKARSDRRALKETRKAAQAENLKRKALEKEEHRQRCLAGMTVDAEKTTRGTVTFRDEPEDVVGKDEKLSRKPLRPGLKVSSTKAVKLFKKERPKRTTATAPPLAEARQTRQKNSVQN